MICLPPTPVTTSLRNRTLPCRSARGVKFPALRKRSRVLSRYIDRPTRNDLKIVPI
jgi:hypothetical protein